MFNLDTLKEKFGMFPVMLFLVIIAFGLVVGTYYAVSVVTTDELVKYLSCVGVFGIIMYTYIRKWVL